MFYFVLFITLLFQNASFAEAQESGSDTGSETECGTITTRGGGLASGGRPVWIGLIPWQAGVYSRRTNPLMQVCGGSVVSAQVVISAAHCFWDEAQMQLPAEDYAVAAGKIYRPWNDMMDTTAQKSDIRAIRIPPRYHGATTNFQDDIALLILTTPFEINSSLRPVCLDFDYDMDKRHLMDGNYGKVAGWGRTAENAKASPILQVVDLPSVDIQRCYDTVEPVFRPAITSDKICAGKKTGGTAVCMGDSGGGLVFLEGDTYRFYLRGVVSTAPTSDNDNLCNIYTYATFTHVLKHEHFIREVMLEASETVVQPTQELTSGNSPSTSSNSQELQDVPSSGTVPLTIVDGGVPPEPSGPSEPSEPSEPFSNKDPNNLQDLSPLVPTSEPLLTQISTRSPETLSKEAQMGWLAEMRGFRGGTQKSDIDTVKVTQELSSSLPNSTETGRPYLSPASKPFLSTEKQLAPFENQPDKLEETQKVQSTPNLPVQNTENQEPNFIRGLPSQSVGNQEQQSKGTLPLPTGYQHPLTRHQPPLSTDSRPVYFPNTYPTTYTSSPSKPDLALVNHKMPSDLGLSNDYGHNHHYPHHRDYENHPHGYQHQGFQHQRHDNAWQGRPYRRWCFQLTTQYKIQHTNNNNKQHNDT